MGNEEYIIQWDDMTPEAKAKKERLEQDPSFRTDHMAYMEGMDQISTDIRDKVMSQVESLSLIHISEPTRLDARSRMPSSA